jgi:hypothetical protein
VLPPCFELHRSHGIPKSTALGPCP